MHGMALFCRGRGNILSLTTSRRIQSHYKQPTQAIAAHGEPAGGMNRRRGQEAGAFLVVALVGLLISAVGEFLGLVTWLQVAPVRVPAALSMTRRAQAICPLANAR